MKGRYGSGSNDGTRPADDARVDSGAHGVRVDAEMGHDGANLPVFAEIESATLGMPLGRDPAHPW
jgi:hypothetical protein